MDKSEKDISIIIPLKHINKYVTEENLPSLANQSYKNFEVILLPNDKNSSDDSLLKKYPWLKIIPTHKVSRPAQKRDIGAREAQGRILAFIDDDAYASKEWLENAVKIFRKKINDREPAVVCGPGILPENSKFWEKVFDAVLCSWAGSGGYAYRFTPKAARIVDDFPSMNFLIKKEIFDAVGGFHSEYWPGEDSKLCEDVVKRNEIICYDPTVVVYHHRRNSIKHYLKQHGNYGYHRGAFFAHGDSNSRRLTYLIPSLFTIYLFFSLAAGIYLAFTPLTIHKYTYFILAIFLPIKLYKLAMGTVFLQNLFDKKNFKVALTAPLVLLLMHLVYGTMFIKGFFIGTIKKQAIY